MRVSYDAVVKLATLKGLGIERVNDHRIDVWVEDGSVTATCATVNEAYTTVYHYEKGKGL